MSRAVALLVAFMSAVVLGSAAFAATQRVEAENMKMPADGYSVQSDTVASGGKYVNLHKNRTISNGFSGAVDKLAVRAKGRYYGGAWPRMVVKIDGTTVMSSLANSSTFKDFTVDLSTNIAGGSHNLSVSFTNDYGTRDLHVDVVTIDSGGAPPADTTAPTVGSIDPPDQATGVANNTNVTATFSEEMDPSTVTTSTFKLVPEGGSTNVGATVSYDATSKKATLNPDADLEAGKKYTATVGTGVKDKAGNSLAADKAWSFTTTNPGGGVKWCPASPEQLTLTANEQEMVKLHNQARSQNGVGELCVDSRLVKAARLHAEDMIDKDYFSHTSQDGRSAGGRISAQGYKWAAYGENISYGSGSYGTPQNVFDRWMNSDGHRSNIVSTKFKDVGIGEAVGEYKGTQDTHMWVANFGALQ
jgi:uncharacterized protein YkwD